MVYIDRLIIRGTTKLFNTNNSPVNLSLSLQSLLVVQIEVQYTITYYFIFHAINHAMNLPN